MDVEAVAGSCNVDVDASSITGSITGTMLCSIFANAGLEASLGSESSEIGKVIASPLSSKDDPSFVAVSISWVFDAVCNFSVGITGPAEVWQS